MSARVDIRSGRACTTDGATSALRERDHRCREGLLDLAQAARYLGTSERHLRRLWDERRITAIKIGRRVRFAHRDLDAFVEAHRHRAMR